MGRQTAGVVRIVALGVAAIALAGPVAAAPAAPKDVRGTEFELAFPKNRGVTATTGELAVQIGGERATTGTVSVPGLGFSQPFAVAPGEVTTVTLPNAAGFQTETTVQAKAVRVTAADEVIVYGLNRSPSSTDGYLALPVDAVGTSYRVLAWGNGPASSGDRSAFVVAATADDTTVTITPATAAEGGRPAGVPYAVSLDRGEAIQVRALAEQTDLTGSTVVASAPVAVFAGHDCANVPSAVFSYCDHMVEQLPPVDAWGKRFVSVPLATRLKGDTFRILAMRDGTQVRVNGAFHATLAAGGTLDQQFTAATWIETSEPVLVAQLANGSSFDTGSSTSGYGDPFLMLLAPLEQYQEDGIFATPASGFTNFVNITVPSAQAGTVTIDGAPVPESDFSPISSSGFSGASVAVTSGTHRIAAARPFSAAVYGFGNPAAGGHTNDSYGYLGGGSLSPVARVAKLSVAPTGAEHFVGDRECLTATVLDSDDAPVEAVRVDFTVVGPHATSASVVADPAGRAAYCYSGATAGTDIITARIADLEAQGTKAWRVRPPAPDPPADPPAPPAPPVPAPAPAVPAPVPAPAPLVATDAPLLRCSGLAVEITEVSPRGRTIRIAGIALTRYAGERVAITRAGKRVGSARVQPDGTFATSVPRPPRRATSARFQAVVEGRRSRALKATRGLVITGRRATKGGVVVSGRLTGRLRARRPLAVRRQLGCRAKDVKRLRTVRTGRDGRFRVTLPRPGERDGVAVYRLRTRSGGETYTLPVLVRHRGT